MEENRKPDLKDTDINDNATKKGFQRRQPLPKTTIRLHDNSKLYKDKIPTKNFNIRRNGER